MKRALVAFALVLSFPVALVLAWVFTLPAVARSLYREAVIMLAETSAPPPSRAEVARANLRAGLALAAKRRGLH